MKKKILGVLALYVALFTSCGGGTAKAEAENNETRQVESEAFQKEAYLPVPAGTAITDNGLRSLNGLPMVVDFSASWCIPCRKLQPVIQKLAKEYAGKVVFLQVDVDEMPELAARFDVNSVPTLCFFDAEGNLKNVTVGLQSEDSLREMVKSSGF